MHSPLITTNRLVIRKFDLDDAEFILELLNEPDWIKFIGDRKIHSVESAKNYIINSIISSYQKFGFGPYLVALKESGTPIGISCLIKREALENVDLGFAFLSQYTGKGYAYESVLATKDYAHTIVKTGPLLAITNLENAASIKLLKKIGLHFDKKILLPGEMEELLLFKE